MSLILEVEYLSGVSFAAIGPDSDAPDWPPQPDRIFSAFVASWAAHGEREEEQRALEWLEKLSAPRLLASDAEPRTGAVAFVPPNDPRSDKQKHARGVLPALLSRQPRRFPATRPHDPMIRLCWPDAEPDESTLSALQMLARDTAYVGHSASLTRCRFLVDRGAIELGLAKLPLRRVYRGRFAELRRTFDAGRRPLPGARVASAPSLAPPRSNIFSDRWLVLEHVAGEMPDVRACALIAKTLRDSLLSGYERLGFENDIPEAVSGHAADGAPSRLPHLAIVPLAFTGFPYADGHLMGFALVPPKDSAIFEDATFRKVLRRIAPIDEARGRRVLTLATKEDASADSAFSVLLSPTFEAPVGKRSLDPTLYMRPAQIFATVTPLHSTGTSRRKAKRASRRSRRRSRAVAATSACRNRTLLDPTSTQPLKARPPPILPANRLPGRTGVCRGRSPAANSPMP